MGWSGFSLKLSKLGKARSERVVDEAMRFLLSRYFREQLPAAWAKKASRWVNWGMDSLVEMHTPEESPATRSIDELTFWFYDSVDWPSSLAQHWIRIALRDKARCGFLPTLRTHGYELADGVELPEVSRVFIRSGAKLGLVTPDGVEWQLDCPTFVADADLSKAMRARAEAARSTGECACHLCTR